MPDLERNQALWNGGYDWTFAGEEWSKTWGGSEAQWFGSLLPRLHRFLPAACLPRILEIAQDMVDGPNFFCRSASNISVLTYLRNASRHATRPSPVRSTRSLRSTTAIARRRRNGDFDLVFSFDSLVHAEIDVIRSYVPQIVRKLSPAGVAFIHHSNLLACDEASGTPHMRARSVSAANFANVVDGNGGKILIQEIINWGCEHAIDCLTLLCRADAFASHLPIFVTNPKFMEEASLIKCFQSLYSVLGDASARH